MNPVYFNRIDWTLNGINVSNWNLPDVNPIEGPINAIKIDGIQFFIFLFLSVYWKDCYKRDGITEQPTHFLVLEEICIFLGVIFFRAQQFFCHLLPFCTYFLWSKKFETINITSAISRPASVWIFSFLSFVEYY